MFDLTSLVHSYTNAMPRSLYAHRTFLARDRQLQRFPMPYVCGVQPAGGCWLETKEVLSGHSRPARGGKFLVVGLQMVLGIYLGGFVYFYLFN